MRLNIKHLVLKNVRNLHVPLLEFLKSCVEISDLS